MRFAPLTVEPVRLPLACDPTLRAANPAEAVDAYVASGDPCGLRVPKGVVHLVVTAPTPYDLAAAEGSAGLPPARGAALARAISEGRASAEGLGGEEGRALSAWHAWVERKALSLLDYCVRVEGAPSHMPASLALCCLVHEGLDVGETLALRRAALDEARVRIYQAQGLHTLPKAP